MGAVFSSIMQALRGVRRNALRSILTAVGVTIGIAAVVVVTALASGARASIDAKIAGLGSNIVFVTPRSVAATGRRAGRAARLTDGDVAAIRREVTTAMLVSPMVGAQASIVAGDRNTTVPIAGVTREYLQLREWKLRSGAMWEARDEALKTRVCVLGATAARELFGSASPEGQTIRVGEYPYTVLGVLEERGDLFGTDEDNILLAPLSGVRSRFVPGPRDLVTAVRVKATSEETQNRAARQITSLLKARHRLQEGDPLDFEVRTDKEVRGLQDSIFQILSVLLLGVATISLVVGGIGIMNIMLVSVAERTREIGIRMAIGARSADIRRQFLVEAVVLSCLGGAFGALLGALLVWLLGSALGWPMKMSSTALVVSAATSFVIGVAFGFVPARRASALDPIVALRRE